MAADRAVTITVDVHDTDRPADVLIAAERLAQRRIRATFFVPGAIFRRPQFRTALRALPLLGHEAGSHGYDHDWIEIEALTHASDRHRLAFLQSAHAIAADFYGTAPTTFRSPVWCHLGPAALDELERLGYTADSSATPQRLMLISSRPFGRGWTFAPRRPHLLRPGLLEIPTSTFVLPLGSPAYRFLRKNLSVSLLSLLLVESRLFASRVVALQFDTPDFSGVLPPRSPLSWRDLVWRRRGGILARRFLQQWSPGIRHTTFALLDRLAHRSFYTLGDYASLWRLRSQV